MSEFGRALTLHDGEFPGSYGADILADWTIGGGINGGVLLATGAKGLAAAMSTRAHTEPLSVTGYFLTPSVPGEALIETDVARAGGSSSTGSAQMVQYDERGLRAERLRILGTFTDLSTLPAGEPFGPAQPDMPPPEECVQRDLSALTGSEVTLLHRLDLRMDPATAGWLTGEPAGEGVLQGWLRLADGTEPGPFALILACDALPPAVVDLGHQGWAPTIELTVQVLARPEPGWLAVQQRVDQVAGGHFVQGCRVWDSSGRLVASARQLARMPRPPKQG